jgi:hypothetical protein
MDCYVNIVVIVNYGAMNIPLRKEIEMETKDRTDLDKFNEHSEKAQAYGWLGLPILFVLGIVSVIFPPAACLFAVAALIVFILVGKEAFESEKYSHYD